MDLDRLAAAMAAFSVLEPTALPLHHVQVFLVVAQNEPILYDDIERILGLSNASVSRTVNALSVIHRTGREGLRLLTVEKDPQERRRYLVSLSARGRALLRQIKSL
jgi:DNA-binding MarR family transcriptional regulator